MTIAGCKEYCKDFTVALKCSMLLIRNKCTTIGVARGAKGAMPPTFLENIVILCFEKRFSKKNSVIRLKSNNLAPPNFLPPP